MDDLTFEDIQDHVVDVVPVELLGKRAYLRRVNFSGQQAIGRYFIETGREGDDATDDDSLAMLALALCKSDGTLIFPDMQAGIRFLNRLDGDEVLKVLMKAQELNGADLETEVKNSEAAQTIS